MSNILSPILSALKSLHRDGSPASETEATARPRRRVPRRILKFRAVVCAKNCRWKARGVNFSENGAMVITNHPLPVKSVVLVYLKSLRLMGFARVRHCSARGLWKHAVGLEFRGPLMRERAGWRFEYADGNTGQWADGEGDSYGWHD